MTLIVRPYGVSVALICAAGAAVAALTDPQHHKYFPLPGGSVLPFDRELPGPDLADGTPTKLYSLALGRAWHNHTADAALSVAVEEKKLARRTWQGRRSLYMSFEDTPLFPGWGTHFAYVYVGTPPQRVSVIIDTGSHYTAFPCSECKNCGSHTDLYWDHSKSSTAHIFGCDQCHGSFRCQKSKRCGFNQRYSEGSSWSAYQVEDVLWVGELTLEESEKLHRDESAYGVDFMFGCIESQTGLFKTQLADGIMGMSADSHTLVWQLAKAGKIKERTFSLCFGVNGGTMVIGGYDQRLNKPGSEVAYTPSTKTSGWFTVKVLDITLNGISIESDPTVYQKGKGIIVDSGTTDTYLPKSVAKGFSKAWESVTGSPYKTCNDNHFCMTLSTADLEALPVITVHLDGGVEVLVRPEAYMDALGKDNAYAPRIYLTESMGGVLGANVMRDHNVVFDYDRHLVGFADGVCEYNADALGLPTGAGGDETKKPSVSVQGPSGQENVDCVTAKEMVKQCDAKCLLGAHTPQTIVGEETWVDVVVTHAKGLGRVCPEEMEEERRKCKKECPAGAPNPSVDAVVEQGKGGEGDDKNGPPVVDMTEIPETYCLIEQEVWTQCSEDCLQERYLDEACEKEAEVRPCHVGDLCPESKAGLLLTTGLALTIKLNDDDIAGDDSGFWMQWAGIAIADAIARVATMNAGNVHAVVIPDDPTAVGVKKLGKRASVPCTAQVEMHLTPKVDKVAADRVSKAIKLSTFPESLTAALEAASHQHWLLRGATITITGAEKVAIFVASNKEAYTPPDSNRLQSERPLSGNESTPVGVRGAVVFAGMVVLAIGVLAWRVNHLGSEEKSYEPVSQELELSMRRQRGLSGAGSSGGVLEGGESGGGSFRRPSKTSREDKTSTGPPE